MGWAGWQGYGPGPARPSGLILSFLLGVASFRETEAENCNQITVNKVNRLTVCLYALLCFSSVGIWRCVFLLLCGGGAGGGAGGGGCGCVCVWRKGIHGWGGSVSDEKLGSATVEAGFA